MAMTALWAAMAAAAVLCGLATGRMARSIYYKQGKWNGKI